MDAIESLKELDPWAMFCGVIVVLIAWSFLQGLWEKTIGKLLKKVDLETKAMRKKRKDKEKLDAVVELAKKTAENLEKLQERHSKDEEEFRQNINNYMEESRKDRKALHDEMAKFTSNRVSDRQQSIQIQQELKDSIQGLVDGQRNRDEKIETLTNMLLDKQISDYRWEIINVADNISNCKHVSKECLKHAISTYAKYEDVIKEHKLTNGEVEISIEIINETYLNLLKEGGIA